MYKNCGWCCSSYSCSFAGICGLSAVLYILMIHYLNILILFKLSKMHGKVLRKTFVETNSTKIESFNLKMLILKKWTHYLFLNRKYNFFALFYHETEQFRLKFKAKNTRICTLWLPTRASKTSDDLIGTHRRGVYRWFFFIKSENARPASTGSEFLILRSRRNDDNRCKIIWNTLQVLQRYVTMIPITLLQSTTSCPWRSN